MTGTPISRRTLVAAASATLGAAVLPAGISRALAAGTPSAGLPEAAPLAFDAAAYVADLLNAGCKVWLIRDAVHPFDPHPRPPFVCIVPPGGRWSAASYGAVMAKWADAMDACPDHVEYLVAHMAGRTSMPQVPT